jgi:hypothetical protein
MGAKNPWPLWFQEICHPPEEQRLRVLGAVFNKKRIQTAGIVCITSGAEPPFTSTNQIHSNCSYWWFNSLVLRQFSLIDHSSHPAKHQAVHHAHSLFAAVIEIKIRSIERECKKYFSPQIRIINWRRYTQLYTGVYDLILLPPCVAICALAT